MAEKDDGWLIDQADPHGCTAASRPSEVYYVVHVNGFYDPIIIRRIE